ncbi:hypothetical protein Tco_0155265 [Tanacetum coccineum]
MATNTLSLCGEIQRISLDRVSSSQIGSFIIKCIKFTMLAVLITKTSPKQDKHAEMFVVDSGKDFIRHCEYYKEYHSECSGKISRIMRWNL